MKEDSSLIHLTVFLLFSTILLTSVPSSSSSAAALASAAHHSKSSGSSPGLSVLKDAEDNETIYRVSKQLCWNCVGESLQFLFYHNLVRASKWELPLMWDSDLERYARYISDPENLFGFSLTEQLSEPVFFCSLVLHMFLN